MKKLEWRMVVGLLLLAFGGILLMQSMGILPATENFSAALFSLLFIAGGAIFILQLVNNPTQNWWAIIPASALIAIGLLIFGGEYLPGITDEVGGGLFLGSIAISFWIIYFLRKESFWWALIPAGVLSTLALIAVDPISRVFPAEFLFFFGVSATFGVVAFTGKPRESFSWAWIPAGILFIIGCIVGVTSYEMKFVFPIMLILVGVAILVLPYILRKLKGDQYE
ncbi:MAG: hypothetical protein JEZ00_01365 [Anaerolineaceae bacterium]|nr:hypothetical protein [Anaerolineaceae bacterium]